MIKKYVLSDVYDRLDKLEEDIRKEDSTEEDSIKEDLIEDDQKNSDYIEKAKLNGCQNMGIFCKFIELKNSDLTGNERIVLYCIANMSLAYCQPIAKRKDGIGMNISEWSKYSGLSTSTFKRCLSLLRKKNYIITLDGSLYRRDGGSYPNMYGINLAKTKELGFFFNLGGIEDLSDRFVCSAGSK